MNNYTFNPNAPRRPDWTLEEVRILRELYPDNNTSELTKFLNRTESAIAIKANKLGLKKSEEFLKSPLSGRYLKKTEPWYKRLIKRLCGKD